MGYADYLKQMLSPLGVYRLDSGYSSAELEALGSALDKVSAELDGHLTGCTFTTACDSYLTQLEKLFPIVEFSESEEERRNNVLTLMAVNNTWSDKASLEKMLDACGLTAEITEKDEKFALKVYFTKIRGELTDRQRAVCEAIMPAHAALELVCDGLIWDRAELRFPTWDDFDNVGLTAFELARLE